MYLLTDKKTHPYLLEDTDFTEPEVKCEICELPATERVDLDPANPGIYLIDLCKGCAMFEKVRINKEIRS
jgi:hypothetical protein